MNIKQYLQDKYRTHTPTTMTSVEARAFGIPFPLIKNWLSKFGSREITPLMINKIKSGLEKRVDKQRKKGKFTGLSATENGLKTLGLQKKVAIPKKLIDPKSDEFLLSWEWRTLRMKVLVKYGATCMCCGASKDDGIVIHVDHIKPRSKYPKLALVEDNLQVLCNVCNQGKSNIDMTDWRPKGGTGYDPVAQFKEFMEKN